MSDGPDLFQLLSICLSRHEWKLCYFIDMLADSEDYGPHFTDLKNYATPGEDSGLWIERFRRIVRWLKHAHGFWWNGLDVRRDGQIIAQPIEPNNQIYWTQLALGKSPDLLDAGRSALVLLEERAPDFDREIIRAAMADLRDAVNRLPERDPDIEQKADEFADVALAAVGVVRDKGVVH